MVYVVLIVLLILSLLAKLSLRPPHFPPGPRGWPLIGNLLDFSKDEPVHKKLRRLATKYGPVAGFYLGPTQPFISVVGYDAVREALLNDDLNGRKYSAIFQTRSFGEKLGLLFTDGPLWQEQRRFTLRHLKELGFGKTSIENQMMDEIQDLIQDIQLSAQSDPDHTVDFKGTFHVSVINIIWAIIGGERFRRDDAAFKRLLSNLDEFVKGGNFATVFFPVPEFLVRRYPTVPKMLGADTRLFQPIQEFIKESIEQHLATRSKGDTPRDFLDVYLDELEEQQSQNVQSTTFTKKQLITSVMDLFGAGADTSSNAIGFAILHLIHHQDVQLRMQKEMDRVCGDLIPSLAHRSSLPYTEAVLMEVLRMNSIAPLALPHCATRTTQLRGFTIPKGSVVTVNLGSVLRDETVWKDPDSFLPERHINQEGKLIRNQAFLPFGLGKRVCLGEPLARNTYFLFVTALVKTFDFKPVPNEELPTLEPDNGFILAPHPFKATVLLRH